MPANERMLVRFNVRSGNTCRVSVTKLRFAATPPCHEPHKELCLAWGGFRSSIPRCHNHSSETRPLIEIKHVIRATNPHVLYLLLLKPVAHRWQCSSSVALFERRSFFLAWRLIAKRTVDHVFCCQARAKGHCEEITG